MTFEDVNWMQNKTFSAREDRQVIAALVSTEGVFSGFATSQRGAGANMSVDITAGKCAIVGDDQANQGTYIVSNISTDNVAIGAAPGSQSRIDLVCVRINDPNATGPAGDNATYVVVAGTVAGSPVPPALPTSAIPIAQVLVASGTVAITNAMITDVRAAARQIGDSPFGVPVLYAGTEASVPADHVLCRGQAISRSTYFPLFRAIGTTYGSGDGSTTFNVPDMRGRIGVGLDNMGGSDAGVLTTANTLGLTGGEELHALTQAETPVKSHTHTIDPPSTALSLTDPGHTHVYNNPEAGVPFIAGNSGTDTNATSTRDPQATATASATTGMSGTVDIAAFTSGAGSDAAATAHNNMPPYMLMNWIMRAI
jgi:microcystin-dependent protein